MFVCVTTVVLRAAAVGGVQIHSQYLSIRTGRHGLDTRLTHCRENTNIPLTVNISFTTCTPSPATVMLDGDGRPIKKYKV
jgi:hypothetical protein